jgi:hypothetical protein
MLTFCSTYYLFVFLLQVVHGAKFAVNGPVLTVTLKDSQAQAAPQRLQPNKDTTVAEALSHANDGVLSSSSKWMNFSGLKPTLFWSIQSVSPPLPNWLPLWTSVRANVGYRYDELKRLPTFVEADFKFRSNRLNVELQVQPSYEVKAKRTNVLLQMSKGASYILARFSASKSAPNREPTLEDYPQKTPATTTSCLDAVRASYNIQFPASSSVSNIRITPTMHVTKQEASCVIEGVTGGSGRTKAILNLNYNNPTLAVVHALDERNTIAPEISLYSAKIIYQWNINLSHAGSSIKTRVDPTSAIDVTWTDTSAADGGRWVTDFRLPLEGTTIQALASDVKVRRQFNF